MPRVLINNLVSRVIGMAPGPAGPAGANGANGVGVPAGGSIGQLLGKASATDYDMQWYDQETPGDVLTIEDVGGAAYLSVGTTAGTVAAGDDARFANPGILELTAGRALANTDLNQTLLLNGTFALTLPDNLLPNLQVPLILRPGSSITFTPSGTSTVVPEGVTLDTTGSTEITSALLTHVATGEWLLVAGNPVIQSLMVACSDQSTALTTGTAKVTFRMPYAFLVTGVRASVKTAPTGAALTVDINEGGTSILSTKLTIDDAEKTSVSAATPAVISDTLLADDAEMTIDIDTVGSTVSGVGLIVSLIGYRL